MLLHGHLMFYSHVHFCVVRGVRISHVSFVTPMLGGDVIYLRHVSGLGGTLACISNLKLPLVHVYWVDVPQVVICHLLEETSDFVVN